jgi:hypothetical protein
MVGRLVFGVLSLVAGAFPQTGSNPAPTSKPAALLHIYRYLLNVGKAAHPTVSCDDFAVARIQNGRVYTMKISVGRHTLATTDDPVGIQLDAETGKEYYLRIDYPVNASFAVRATPVLVATDQGSQEIRKLRPLDGWFVETGSCGRN